MTFNQSPQTPANLTPEELDTSTDATRLRKPVASVEPAPPETPKSAEEKVPELVKPEPPKLDTSKLNTAKLDSAKLETAKNAEEKGPEPAQPETPSSAEVPLREPDQAELENPYALSGEVDRARLVAQTGLFRKYIERNAKQFVGEDIKNILDLGCGEGQLTIVFSKLYPEAHIVGIDKDEKAIEVAHRAARGMPNVEFKIADITQGLPTGPFDLIYSSLVLMHIPGTPKIIRSIYEALKPGGLLWTKDLHPNMATAVDHPAFARLSHWMGDTMDRIGAPWRIGGQLVPILSDAGFKIKRTEEEVYTLGTRSTEERITMAINLGAMYNARKLMTRVLQVPEIEVVNTHRELVAAMMAPNGPRGNFVYANVVSQRPS